MRKHYYGYNIVASGFLIQAVCLGAMFTYGVFFKVFQEEFGWSRAVISGASSLNFFCLFSIVAELFGTDAHGALFGLVWFSGAVGGSIGPWLAGFVFDKTDSYRLAFMILLMLALTGLGLVVCLRPLNRTRPGP